MVKAILSDIGNVVAFWDGMKVATSLAPFFPSWKAEDIDQRLHQDEEGREITRRFETGRLTDDEYMREVGFLFGHDTLPEWFWPAHNDMFTANTPVIELWREIKRQPRKTALIALTDTDARRLPWVLEVSRVTFDSIVASYHCGMRKPDPAFFHHAVQVAGADVSECLFVDDRDPFVEAARALGIYAHHYDPKDRKRDRLLRDALQCYGLLT